MGICQRHRKKAIAKGQGLLREEMEMSEKESEKENKPKIHKVELVEGIKLKDSVSVNTVSTVSGSIQQSFNTLRGTFDVNQNTIADSLRIDQNFEYLKDIAANMEKSVKLAEEQRDEAIKDAKRERRNFNISLAVTIVFGIVAVIIGILAL